MQLNKASVRHADSFQRDIDQNSIKGFFIPENRHVAHDMSQRNEY